MISSMIPGVSKTATNPHPSVGNHEGFGWGVGDRSRVDGTIWRQKDGSTWELDLVGTYDGAAPVVVRNRTQGGVAGAWLVTPLALDSGDRVGVLRGFVTFGPDGAVAEAPPPAGEVTVEGLVVDPGSFDVGTKMRMVFRVREYDKARGFRKYFWKATPAG